MPETRRERIIQALLGRAATITIAKGFSTDIGASTLRAVVKVDPTLLPACVVFPSVETAERIGGGEVFCTMPVTIEGVAMVGVTGNASVLSELILGDIRSAFFGSSITDLIDELSYVSGGSSSYASKDAVTVTVKILVRYYSKISDPFY